MEPLTKALEPLTKEPVPWLIASAPLLNVSVPSFNLLVPSCKSLNPLLIVSKLSGTSFTLFAKLSTIVELTVLSKFFSTFKTTLLIIWLAK